MIWNYEIEYESGSRKKKYMGIYQENRTMKIGVIGAGRIVRLFLSAVDQVEGAVCTAICTREKSMVRAGALAREHGIPSVYNDVDVFLQEGDFDWVYIGVENVLHYTYAKMALSADKHVIVEKPICGTYAQVQELYQLAKQSGRFLFEAMMIHYLPLYEKLKEEMKRLVDIKIVTCNFSKVSSAYAAYMDGNVGHFFDKDAYGGALYDLNIYNFTVIVGLFGMPVDVKYFANPGYNGVDTSGIAILIYPGFQVCCVAAKDSDGVDGFQIQARNGCISMDCATALLSNLTVCVVGITNLYQAEDAHDIRMAYELKAMKLMWETDNLDDCYSILEQSMCVIDIIEKLHQWHTAN